MKHKENFLIFIPVIITPGLMRFFFQLNTYYRLLLLAIGTCALFFILYLSLYFYTLKQEKSVYNSAYKEYQNEINSIFELNSKTPMATVLDISFWDELVDFIKYDDKEWYKDYVDAEFTNYEADYIGVYNLKHELLGKSLSSKLKTENFIPKEVDPLLHEKKSLRFYLQIPEGIVEVFAATIHPSDDPKKIKHQPSGYFYMARLLDSSFIHKTAELTSSQIKLVPTDYIDLNTEEHIAVMLDLKNWAGTSVAKLNFERPFNLSFNSTKKILFIIIVATLVNFFICLYYYRRWIYKPVNLITNILENGDEQFITQLKSLAGEFSHIGQLFEENNHQKKQLEIAKEKAEESDRLKSSFLANLSHEIRTPMNAIMGFSDLLENENLTEKEKSDYLKVIRNSGKNLVSIIEDLIEMSKIDANQINPNYNSIDLDKCISELYETIKITIPEEKKIKLSVQKSSEDLKRNILSDETKLKQILINLVTNAIKYTQNGMVLIGYQVNEIRGTIDIWVQDTGAGIEGKNLNIIFDRFRRGDDNLTTTLSGLGLGLSIIKAYIELLGGTIQVQSELGVGSTFSFSIPLKYDKEPKTLATEKKLPKQQHIGKETILIAEDDDINFLLMNKLLSLKNYNVLRAKNGKEAVEICRTHQQIDLVFMDIKMPIMGGFEALKLIRQFNTTLPIIANTAYSSNEDKKEIMEAGFNGYLTKPIQKEKLFELFDHFFEME